IENLYNNGVPRSVFGLNFNFNIFDGIKKINNIRSSQLMEKRIDLGMTQLKNQINSEYQLALASYNAGINDWQVAKENMQMSKDVYDIIKLQYDEGIKTYLDLMNADTDLKASQVNYLNALYSVLSSKLDVQKAMGTITTSSKK
ncbi:MAG TPA: TolC family protein, partial [Chitinophagales bacterium]|nr:TolC family protein [Chitinophagales bacterium]